MNIKVLLTNETLDAVSVSEGHGHWILCTRHMPYRCYCISNSIIINHCYTLGHCWASVADGVRTSTQHYVTLSVRGPSLYVRI